MKILFPERTVRTEGQWLEKNNKEGVFPLYLSEKKFAAVHYYANKSSLTKKID